MAPRRSEKPVITSARWSRSLDADTRTRRYLWTMGLRVACFAAAAVVPGYWKLVMLAASAVLPTIAVLFANAVDHRRAAELQPHDEEPAVTVRELSDHLVITGTVEEEHGPATQR